MLRSCSSQTRLPPLLYLTTATQFFIAKVKSDEEYETGKPFKAQFDLKKAHLFDAETEEKDHAAVELLDSRWSRVSADVSRKRMRRGLCPAYLESGHVIVSRNSCAYCIDRLRNT